MAALDAFHIRYFLSTNVVLTPIAMGLAQGGGVDPHRLSPTHSFQDWSQSRLSSPCIYVHTL